MHFRALEPTPRNTPNLIPPANLLIVDDDSPANLQLLGGMLRQHGYKVRPVPNGELALQAARNEPPDLILLDITMPGMSGYEVCERLKIDPVLKSIPVIFISALDDVIDKVKAFAVGGVDYVAKPFQFAEVEARVKTHLTLRRQERQLEQSLAELKELERLRDSLVHMVVHDMRSPIAAMRMSLEMLQSGPAQDTASKTKMLTVAQRAADSLNEMATQLLDISRLEAGQMPINKMRYDLSKTLASTVDSMTAMAGERRLLLDTPATCCLPYDQDLIGRVLTNLLTNAIKFTPQGGEIRSGLKLEEGVARVTVADNGHGIAPEHHRRIFEKFGQADIKHKRIGTGLGLAFLPARGRGARRPDWCGKRRWPWQHLLVHLACGTPQPTQMRPHPDARPQGEAGRAGSPALLPIPVLPFCPEPRRRAFSL